ncbi:hypothetical protein V8E51_013142 [Hyaloscypha variabilis]
MLKSQLYHLLFLPLPIMAQLNSPLKARLALDEEGCNPECDFNTDLCFQPKPPHCTPGSAQIHDERFAIGAISTFAGVTNIVTTSTVISSSTVLEVTTITLTPEQPSSQPAASSTTASPNQIATPTPTQQTLSTTPSSILTTVVEWTTLPASPGSTDSFSFTSVQTTGGGRTAKVTQVPSSVIKSQAGGVMAYLGNQLLGLGMAFAAMDGIDCVFLEIGVRKMAVFVMRV